MMYVPDILILIQQHIKATDGEFNQEKWVIALSRKKLNQLKQGSKKPIAHVKEIGSIDHDFYERLLIAFQAARLNIIAEPGATTIFLYKLNI